MFLWVDCACDHTHVYWNWDVNFGLTHLFKANRARIIHLTICLNWSLSIRIWVNINDHDGAIVKWALYLQLGSWIYADYLTHRISWSFCWKAIINHGKYRNVNFGGHVPFRLDGTINQAIDSVVRLIYCDPLKGVSKANSFTIGNPI